MPETMIAYCGLTCTECPGYLATLAHDEARVAAIAEEWSKQYGTKVTAENVWCDGCLVGGKKCAHCSECEIRACGRERGVANCGHCDDYVCDKLTGFFEMVPEAKATLDKVRAGL